MDEPKPKPDDGQNESVSLFGLLGLGLQLTVTVLLFYAAGQWTDAHWGWAPWGTQGLSLLGIAVGLFFFLKEAIR